MNDIDKARDDIAVIKKYAAHALRCVSIPNPDWDGYYDDMASIECIACDIILKNDDGDALWEML